MTRLTYFRAAVTLPLAAPIIAVGLMLIPSLGAMFLVPGVLLGGSMVYGGPAYAVCAAGALLYLRHRDAAAARRLALLAPLLVAPFVGLTNLLADAAVVGWTNGHWLREEFLGGVVLGLILGYAYVALILAGDSFLTAKQGSGHRTA
jgi:hypothetical protein